MIKSLFVVVYTIISIHLAPCTHKSTVPTNFYVGCAVNHGWVTDTSQVEVFTMDSNKVNQILKEHPNATVDTFVLSSRNK